MTDVEVIEVEVVLVKIVRNCVEEIVEVEGNGLSYDCLFFAFTARTMRWPRDLPCPGTISTSMLAPSLKGNALSRARKAGIVMYMVLAFGFFTIFESALSGMHVAAMWLSVQPLCKLWDVNGPR